MFSNSLVKSWRDVALEFSSLNLECLILLVPFITPARSILRINKGVDSSILPQAKFMNRLKRPQKRKGMSITSLAILCGSLGMLQYE